MPIVDVTLNHRVYPIACEQGQEDQVRQVARFLQHRVKELRNQAPGATDAHLLVMVCLMLADELAEARAQTQAALSAGPRQEGAGPDDPDAEAVASTVSILADRIESIAQRLDQA